MDEKKVTAIVSVLLAITGLAVIALLVSSAAKTTTVAGAFGTSLSQMICTALSPVTGKNCSNLIESVTSTITYG